ncbi:hypothetical protein LCGC14_0533610 [marine sediment metagenome]|uniref:VWFA domain-containing protein n=1 Tax=marine sediment metagenome TaxID=412755 RepID=A0A0F9UGG0_9ZZZZ
MDTTVNFTHEKVRHDQDNEVHLVVSLKAPKKDWEKERPPICVFPVIDISQSMTGQKIEYAKRSAMKLVEHLQPGDFCGLAVFSDNAELVSPPMEMTQDKKTELKNKIGDLRPVWCTNFSGGMLMGLEQLNKADLPKDLLKRVIMLTDGQANTGVAKCRRTLLPLLESNLGAVTMSCFGYGEDADQELLADLAKKGKGNYAFIQNPDDALNAFAKELGGLLSTYAQNIEIKVLAKNGHTINEVVSDVDTDGDDKKVTIKLPEILSEEEQHVVIKTTLSEQSKALPRKLLAFDVKVSCDVVNKDGKLEKVSDNLKAKMAFVKPGKEQKKADKKLDEIVALAQMVKVQIEAEEQAKRGDYSGAVASMGFISDNFATRGLEKYSTAADKLGGKMRSKQAFTSSSSYLNSYKTAGRRAYGASGMSADARNDFCGLVGESTMTNDAMKSTTDSFTVDDGADPDVVSSKITIDIDTDPNPQWPITTSPAPDTTIIITQTPPKKEKEKEKKVSSVTKKRSKRW